MNERIKIVRKHLHLTLDSFSSRIGITSSGLSKIERGLSGASEQTILSICREFNVNETWLRTGDGDMFDQDQPSILSRLADEYKLTAREQSALSAFLELSDSDRAAIMRYVDKLVEKFSPASVSDTTAEAVAAARDYMNMVADEKNNMDESSTSAG